MLAAYLERIPSTGVAVIPRAFPSFLAGILLLPLPLPASDDVPAAWLTPRQAGTLLVDNLLQREYMYYGDEALHYAEAAAAVGALRFAAAIGDAGMQERIIVRYLPLLDDAGGLVSRRAHVDMNVIGIVPLQVAVATGDATQRAQGLSFADAQWAETLPSGLTAQSRWWIDDLYMVGMLQMEAWRASGNLVYADRAAAQLTAYLPRLQNDDGLFFHSPDVPILWGRGNGWVAVAMAEVLADLPAGHPQREFLLSAYRRMMRTLLGYQGEDGMWRQILDYPEAWAESSGTAMFAYAMALGLNHSLLPPAPYRPAVERAWLALTGLLDPAGNLAEVCIGTAKENAVDYYLARPRVSGDLHGQAPMLWLATALLGPGFESS